jgi:hypothetical protein
LKHRSSDLLIMRHILKFRALLALVAFVATLSPAFAQFEFEDPAEAEAPAADVVAPAADNDAAAAGAVELANFALRDPMVAAVLDLPRETPAQKLVAVCSLIDLGRNDVAALLLPELTTAELDDPARALLVRQLGAARFMQLMRLDAPGAGDASPLPGARDFAQECLDAAAAEAADPARIANIIAQLSAPTEEARYAARVDLRATGEAGIVAAMTALAKSADPEARGRLIEALGDLRPTLDAPLLAALAESGGQMRADAAEMAGRLRIRAALPWLSVLAVSTEDPTVAAASQAALRRLGLPQPTPEEAQELVRRELAAMDAAPAIGANDTAEAWWWWDAATMAPVHAEFPPRQRRILARARLAQALGDAGGVDVADRRVAIVEGLEAAQLLGHEPPAASQEELAAATPAELSAMLAAAVEHERFAAAARLAGEIGARGDASVLSTADGRPGPLAAAIASPVRELRFAALAAVMQLNPTQTFPGASQVAKALWFFAAGGGDPAVVVAAPVFPQASNWAGQLRGLGYEATPAATGRNALIAAFDPAAAPRLALVMLDSDISYPVMREVVFQLRSSARTAEVPILLASSTGQFAAAERIAAHDPLIRAVPRPRDDAALADDATRTLALSPHPLPEKAVRTQQAVAALDWLAQLLAVDAPYDELRRDGALVGRTLFVPELAEPSIRVLGALGTADSQAALADYASTQSFAIESRRAAAAALAGSFKRFGIQLTRDQVRRQYDRYNASETADADTQQLLGGILDALETKE